MLVYGMIYLKLDFGILMESVVIWYILIGFGILKKGKNVKYVLAINHVGLNKYVIIVIYESSYRSLRNRFPNTILKLLTED